MAHVDEHDTATRRDFLYVATGAAGAVAGAAVVWPMVNQMNPSADVAALSSIQVDISAVEEGSQITISYLGKPVFVRHRTPEDIAEANAEPVESLPDPFARNANLPPDSAATDTNRSSLDPTGVWLVMTGVCTHLGCVPLADAGDYGGWFCPCHGSHYDTAGRIRKGPAPENLTIPVASFVSDGVLKLG